MIDQEIEEIPLRHERDELAVSRQMFEVGKEDDIVSDESPQLVDFLVRSLKEFVEKAELIDYFDADG